MTRCSKHQAVTGSSPPIPNVTLSSEQTSLSCFLFPLSLIFFFKVYSKAAAKTVFLYCCSDDIILFPNSPLSHGQSLPSFPWTAFVSPSTSFSPYTMLLLTNCYTKLSFLMSQCWNIYSSVLQIKRVFPFLYPRLPQISSKPTSCTYSLL